MPTTATILKQRNNRVDCLYTFDSGETLITRGIHIPEGGKAQAIVDARIAKMEATKKENDIQRDPGASGDTSKEDARTVWWIRIFNAMHLGEMTQELIDVANRVSSDSDRDVAGWVGWTQLQVTEARVKLDAFLLANNNLDHSNGS